MFLHWVKSTGLCNAPTVQLIVVHLHMQTYYQTLAYPYWSLHQLQAETQGLVLVAYSGLAKWSHPCRGQLQAEHSPHLHHLLSVWSFRVKHSKTHFTSKHTATFIPFKLSKKKVQQRVQRVGHVLKVPGFPVISVCSCSWAILKLWSGWAIFGNILCQRCCFDHLSLPLPEWLGKKKIPLNRH